MSWAALQVDTGAPHAGRPGREDLAPLRVAAPPALDVGVPELGVLAPRLGDHPEDVAAELEEPPVEGDEGPELPAGSPARSCELGHGLVDVRALLGGVDQRVRQPGLVAVDAVDGGLGDAGALRDRADAGAGPAPLEEAGAGRRRRSARGCARPAARAARSGRCEKCVTGNTVQVR